MNRRFSGRLTEWRDEQGFGFITPDEGGARVFVHIKDMADARRRPQPGDRLVYGLARDDRGRQRAIKVACASAKPPVSKRRRARTGLVLFAILFLAAMGASTAAGKLPPMVMLIHAVMSALAFASYALDKSAAVRGRWRTRERTLILMGLLGGWPGALLAQQFLRHKSRKTDFQIDFWLSVVVNLAVIGWLFTEPGGRAAQTLQSLLAGLAL